MILKIEPSMIAETITVMRDEKGNLYGIDNCDALKRLLDDYKREELKDSEVPYHYEAEIAAGLKYFVEWAKTKKHGV